MPVFGFSTTTFLQVTVKVQSSITTYFIQLLYYDISLLCIQNNHCNYSLLSK